MSVPTRSKRAARSGIALAVGLACSRLRPPPRPPRSTSPPPAPSWSSAAPPSRTPARRCSTAISGSPRARRSSASGSPPWSTAPRTPTTPSPRRRSSTSPPPTTSRPDSRSRPPTTSRARTSATGSLNGRRLPLHLVGPAHRPAHPRRRGRSQRAVRLRDRLDADHRIGQLGRAGQRRLPVQRLLAGRQLGDARHHHGVPGQPDGAHEHLAEQRRHGDRPDARPQRPGQPDQQRPRQQPLLRRGSTSTGTRRTAPGTLAAPAPVPARRHGGGAGRGAGEPGEQPASARPRATARRACERTPHATCTSGFRATVRGHLIKRVVFSLDGKRDPEPGQARRSWCSCGPCPARTG